MNPGNVMHPPTLITADLPCPRFRTLPSAIRRSSSQESLDGPSTDLVDLSLGQPTWSLPEPARKALGEIASAPYSSHLGLTDLRQTIAEIEGDGKEDRVLITTGAQGALHALAHGFLGPDDIALVPDPGFPAYAALIHQSGARPLAYRLKEEDGFQLDPSVIEAALRQEPRIRLVFICHPSNPTGARASSEALRRTAELCATRSVLLVADETYRHLHPPDLPTPPSLATVAKGLTNTAVVSSVSKAWAAPGLRIGWLIADPRVVEVCRSVHAWATTCAAEPCQRAARALLEKSPTILPQSRLEVETRWRAFARAWQERGRPVPRRPEGGLYAWLRGTPPAAEHPFVFWGAVREKTGVAVVPGLAFGEAGRSWARVSLGARPEDLTLGIRRLLSMGAIA